MPYYDHDKNYPFAAFITNLGKYNEGELVGEWVKFPTTAEELKEVFKRIGIGQKDDFGQPYGSSRTMTAMWTVFTVSWASTKIWTS